VEASVGICVCREGSGDSEDLLAQADIAMYHAKRQHTGVEFYNPDGDEGRRDSLELLSQLRRGIAAGELVVYYQPKAEADSTVVSGFEALVRWQHPTRGLLFPDTFMPLAENTGLMRPLTSYVLDQALSQCRFWRNAGHEDLTVAVNISTRNVLDEGLPAEVRERLEAHDLPASALEIEITETTLMVHPVRAKKVLDGLASLGVRLAIDDFGTGNTSLAWLADLPVTTLKIDKSFVMSMTTQSENAAIVRSSVQIGSNLGLSVVAEGVEDQESWSALTDLGCDYVQGYYLSKPKPPEAFDRWLQDRQTARR
jgi:EAL domain-containing protein (putative c-di-GMP-specific phosphodiesterase class I)